MDFQEIEVLDMIVILNYCLFTITNCDSTLNHCLFMENLTLHVLETKLHTRIFTYFLYVFLCFCLTSVETRSAGEILPTVVESS